MNTTWLQRIVLGVAGITALSIGTTILSAPISFYATYGVDLGSDPNLLSELRAPGANLALLGAVMCGGAVYSSMARLSAILYLVNCLEVAWFFLATRRARPDRSQADLQALAHAQ